MEIVQRTELAEVQGLGIVDIARKCDSPIDYIVNPVDAISFFNSVSFKKDNQ